MKYVCLLCCDESGSFEGRVDSRGRNEDERERSKRGRRRRVTGVKRRSNRAKVNTEPSSLSTVQSAAPLLRLSIHPISPHLKDSLPFKAVQKNNSQNKKERRRIYRKRITACDPNASPIFRALVPFTDVDHLQFAGLLIGDYQKK